MDKALTQFLLKRLDVVATPVFSRGELPEVPQSEWEELETARVLLRAKEPESIEYRGKCLVVRRSDDDIFGFDEDEDFPRPIPLTEDDLVTYRLNISGFLDVLRDLNRIQGRDALPFHGFYQLGRCDIAKIGRVTVYLSIQNSDPAETQRRLTFLAGQSGTKLAVFPTWPAFDTSAYLPQALHIADLNPDLTLEWPPELLSGEPEAARSMVCDGRNWTIQFDGVRKSVQNLTGIRYIAFLVQNPGIPIPAAAVKKLELPAKIDLTPATNEFGSYESDQDRRFGLTGEGGRKRMKPKAPPDAKQNALVEAYKTEIRKLKAAKNFDAAAELQRSLDEILGDDAPSDEIDKAALATAEAVRKAIGRAFLELKAMHPEAHEHLKDAISRGPVLMYKRPPHEAWHVRFS